MGKISNQSGLTDLFSGAVIGLPTRAAFAGIVFGSSLAGQVLCPDRHPVN